MDDHAAVPGDGGPVAVTPDVVERVEVGGAVPGAVGIVPEAHGHRRERTGADELALPARGQRPSVVAEDLDRHAQPARLQLALPDRKRRVAEREARDDVGAARDRGELHVRLHVAVDVVEALVGERRAGRHHQPQAGEIVGLPRLHAGLLDRREVFRRGSEDRHAFPLAEVPQDRGRRVRRVALVEQQRRAERQGRDLPVPHHPAAGRDIEHAVAGLQVAMQAVLLQVLQQRPAVAVDDALRRARRAGRIHDEERMIEGHLGEGDAIRRRVRGGLAPGHGVRQGREIRRLLDIRHDRDRLDARQVGEHVRDARPAVEGLAAVEVAVGADQRLRFDLAETVEHPARAEIGRAGRPHRAQARGRQHGGHRLGQVGQEPRDAVAPAHPLRLEPDTQGRHRVVEFREGHRAARAVLAPAHDGLATVAAAQQVLRVVEPRPGEPPRAGHRVAVFQDRVPGRRGDDAAELPEQRPEPLAILDRPAPQGVVVAEVAPALPRGQMAEAGHGRGRGAAGIGGPENVVHGRFRPRGDDTLKDRGVVAHVRHAPEPGGRPAGRGRVPRAVPAKPDPP